MRVVIQNVQSLPAQDPCAEMRQVAGPHLQQRIDLLQYLGSQRHVLAYQLSLCPLCPLNVEGSSTIAFGPCVPQHEMQTAGIQWHNNTEET